MSTFEVTRRIRIAADPDRIHGLVDDFHAWRAWSPWEDIDPAMQRTYAGPQSGVGSRYSWSGNRRAGAGSMEITSSTPEEVRIRLEFTKPMKTTNQTVFGIRPSPSGGIDVSWTMTGEQKGLWALVGKVYPMDRLVGKDFEKGLSRLKATAESA